MQAGVFTVRISKFLCVDVNMCRKQLTVYEIYYIVFSAFGVAAGTGPILSASLY